MAFVGLMLAMHRIALVWSFTACVWKPLQIEAAYATRYWDCCKAHCSWPSNLFNKVSPLPICNKDDVKLDNPFTPSSCGAPAQNSAYTCHDNIPFRVTDSLAYGFAAVPASGDMCGKCYQLMFSGTGKYGPNPGAAALYGKSMIVQATNIGHDVNDEQFDIMIPGGGVGLFDACTYQWGVQTSQLGAQYGGFLTQCQQVHGYNAPLNTYKDCVRNHCQGVFGDQQLTTLYEGCVFFVDWFQVADNPTLTYQEVSCPYEIVQISGMNRSDSAGAPTPSPGGAPSPPSGECEIDGSICDCSWATGTTCLQDDGSLCNHMCCCQFRESTGDSTTSSTKLASTTRLITTTTSTTQEATSTSTTTTTPPSTSTTTTIATTTITTTTTCTTTERSTSTSLPTTSSSTSTTSTMTTRAKETSMSLETTMGTTTQTDLVVGTTTSNDIVTTASLGIPTTDASAETTSQGVTTVSSTSTVEDTFTRRSSSTSGFSGATSSTRVVPVESSSSTSSVTLSSKMTSTTESTIEMTSTAGLVTTSSTSGIVPFSSAAMSTTSSATIHEGGSTAATTRLVSIGTTDSTSPDTSSTRGSSSLTTSTTPGTSSHARSTTFANTGIGSFPLTSTTFLSTILATTTQEPKQSQETTGFATTEHIENSMTETTQSSTTMTSTGIETTFAPSLTIAGQFILQLTNEHLLLEDAIAIAAFENEMKPKIVVAAGNGIALDSVDVVVSAPIRARRRRLQMGVVISYAITVPPYSVGNMSSFIENLNEKKPIDLQRYAMSAFQAASSEVPALASVEVQGVIIKAIAAVASPVASSTTATDVDAETTRRKDNIDEFVYVVPNSSIALLSGADAIGDTSSALLCMTLLLICL